jgi:hypothetical protein
MANRPKRERDWEILALRLKRTTRRKKGSMVTASLVKGNPDLLRTCLVSA